MENNKIADRQYQYLIDVNKDAEMRAWADKFDVTKAKLKAAVNAVGVSAKDVELYLTKRKK